MSEYSHRPSAFIINIDVAPLQVLAAAIAVSSAQLVTYPNGAQAPYDPNVALATAQHYAAKVYILKTDGETLFSSVSRLPRGPGYPWRAPPMFTPPPRRSPQSSMAVGRGLLMPRPRYKKRK